MVGTPTVFKNSTPTREPRQEGCTNACAISVSPNIERTVLTGILKFGEALHWGLGFESFPIWGLALNRKFCLTVSFLDVTSHKALMQKLDPCLRLLLTRCIQNIGVQKLRFKSRNSFKIDVCLYSGTLSYLKSVCLRSHSTCVLMLSSPWRRRSTPSTFHNVKWRIYHPTDYGGGVGFPILMGFQGLEVPLIKESLVRSVGHFLDHGIRPKATSFSGNRPGFLLRRQLVGYKSLDSFGFAAHSVLQAMMGSEAIGSR